MGSRGASLKTGGFTEYKYKTIMRDGNVRFVIQKDTSRPTTQPQMSNSPGATYAVLNKEGKLKTIVFYDRARHHYKEVDVSRPHPGLDLWHVHEINPETRNRVEINFPARNLTKRERTKIQKIVDFYEKNNLKKRIYASLRFCRRSFINHQKQ